MEVGDVLQGQGRNYQRLGKLPEAERSLRRSLAIRQARFGPTSSPSARTRMLLGKVLTDAKRYPEADELLRIADENFRKNEGVADQKTQDAIQARIALYKAWGKTDKAKELEAALAPAKAGGRETWRDRRDTSSRGSTS